ncbi:MAG: fimbrillin family protein, partial [Prevotella sp.]|nr:fimbrillin family protein [Prevotella sp.]
MIKKRLNFVTRFLPGLFTGLLLFSGCSQDDVSGVPVGSRAIGFRAQGGMSSLKATTTSKEYIQSFVVNAHYGDDWTPETGKYLLRGTTVYRGEDDNWAYSPQAYFPTTDEGAVGFFAYSPSGSKNVETGLKDAATANQTITCKVPSPTGPATTQEDLLVACTGVLQVNNAYPGTVSLQFRHALSRILVKAVSTLDKEVSVTVTGLTLRNLHSKGTLNLKDVPDTGATGWVYTEVVEPGDDPDDVYVKWDAPAVLSNYSYSLPESGVSVSDAPKFVTG